jgi:hypothetical protein
MSLTSTRIQGITSGKRAMFIIAALRMSNLTKIKYKIDGPGGGI